VFEVFLNGFSSPRDSDLGIWAARPRRVTLAISQRGSLLIAVVGVRALNHRNLLRKRSADRPGAYVAIMIAFTSRSPNTREVSAALTPGGGGPMRGRRCWCACQDDAVGLTDVNPGSCSGWRTVIADRVEDSLSSSILIPGMRAWRAGGGPHGRLYIRAARTT